MWSKGLNLQKHFFFIHIKYLLLQIVQIALSETMELRLPSLANEFFPTVPLTSKRKKNKLTLSQTSPGFCMYKSFENTVRKKEKLLITSNFSFSHSVFYLPFSSNSKMSPAKSFSLEKSIICSLGKG